jgi:hypothetical protein
MIHPLKGLTIKAFFYAIIFIAPDKIFYALCPFVVFHVGLLNNFEDDDGI